MERLLGKSLLTHLLPAVRCDTLEGFIDSVHCCDLVCRMPHPDEQEAVLCSRFSPLGDLRNSLDMRLRRMAGILSDAAAAAAQTSPAGEAGTSAAAVDQTTDDAEKSGEADTEAGEGAEKAAEGNAATTVATKGKGKGGQGGRKGKNRGKRTYRVGKDGEPHSLRLVSLLRDHQLMWGYSFVPDFCGTSAIAETVNVFLSDMVVFVEAGRGARGARWVRVSPETLLRYMIQDKLQQAEIAIVDAEEKKLLAASAAQDASRDIDEGKEQAAPDADAEAPMHDGSTAGQEEGEGEQQATDDDDIEVVAPNAVENAPVGSPKHEAAEASQGALAGESGADKAAIEGEKDSAADAMTAAAQAAEDAADEGPGEEKTGEIEKEGEEVAEGSGVPQAHENEALGDADMTEPATAEPAEKLPEGEAAETPAVGEEADAALDAAADAPAKGLSGGHGDGETDADAGGEVGPMEGDADANAAAEGDGAAAAVSAGDAAMKTEDPSEGAGTGKEEKLEADVAGTEDVDMKCDQEQPLEGDMPMASEDGILQVYFTAFFSS
jgi:trimeric autotransporter adhesin